MSTRRGFAFIKVTLGLSVISTGALEVVPSSNSWSRRARVRCKTLIANEAPGHILLPEPKGISSNARRRHEASIFDVFTLNPLPYPVLLLLIVIFLFLGISWSFSYESVVEDAELNFGLFLKVVPVLLLLLVHLLSRFENPERWFYTSPYDRRRKAHYFQSSDGAASPWWVLGLIVVLLVMVSYQSTFLDGWFG